MNKSIFFTIVVSLISMFSTHANAAVTFEIISGNSFVGQTSGPLGDPYWEGGANDAPLSNFFDPASTGLNTIGSSGIFLAYDNLQNFNFMFESFTVGNTVYDGSLVLGDNIVSSIFRESETIGFGDGTSSPVQSLVGTNNIVTINPNTYSYTNLITEDANFTYTSSTINAYSLAAGQDAAAIFAAADPSIFIDSINGNIDPARLANQFDYLASQVDPLWTALGIEFFQTTATAKDPLTFDDFSGLGYYSFVSYDAGASPVPVPAAFWLFGSVLIGMVRWGRKRA